MPHQSTHLQPMPECNYALTFFPTLALSSFLVSPSVTDVKYHLIVEFLRLLMHLSISLHVYKIFAFFTINRLLRFFAHFSAGVFVFLTRTLLYSSYVYLVSFRHANIFSLFHLFINFIQGILQLIEIPKSINHFCLTFCVCF